MPNFLAALLFAVSFAALTGCGQTGPLYMPGETPPKHKHGGSGGAVTQPQVEPTGSGGAVDQSQVEPGDESDAEDPLLTP